MLFVKDFYDALDSESEMDISSLVHGVPVVSDLADAMQVIESIRKSPVHMVLAHEPGPLSRSENSANRSGAVLASMHATSCEG